MTKKTRAAILGYGNIGKYAVEAIQASPDLELAGVVEPAAAKPDAAVIGKPNIDLVTSIDDLTGVEVALLCIPTRSVPGVALELLGRGINTVDSYDIHNQLADLRLRLDEAAKKYGAVAVNSAGWDPGSDSMVRCMFEFMLPRGITYTNFGPGMSMGHSVAAKSIPGVANALSMTIPSGTGVHRRMVYVQLQAGADFNQVEAAIKSDS